MSDDVWNPLSPQQSAEVFDPLGIAWWIAGGIAIDMFVGRTTREHGDIDVAVLRHDTLALAPLLTEWDVCIAHDGKLIPWSGETLPPDMHQFWVRPSQQRRMGVRNPARGQRRCHVALPPR